METLHILEEAHPMSESRFRRVLVLGLAVLLLIGSLGAYHVQHYPTSEEAGSFLWGFPWPWLETGPAHVGIGGSANPLQASGAFDHPRVLGLGLALDTLFWLGCTARWLSDGSPVAPHRGQETHDDDNSTHPGI